MFINSFKLLLIVSTLYAKCLADDKCVLPPYPKHGAWTMAGKSEASPGQTHPSFVLEYTCDKGYQIDKSHKVVACIEGKWHLDIPKCVRSCRLDQHPSVEYWCLISGPNGEEGSRDCNVYEPVGTIVRPDCKKPNYYSPVPLTLMRCQEGGWDTYPICTPECGLISPNTKLILDGGHEREGLPWHAAVYMKTTTPYQQICGGSLVSSTVVLSAAHCFWRDIKKQLPASEFAVAVGKQYRAWDHPKDEQRAQKSDVSEIKLPLRFLGSQTNFQDDIAVLVMKSSFQFTSYVRPVCLDFDYAFEGRQLKGGNYGKVAGWSLYKDNLKKNSSLEVLSMPYVDIADCLAKSPASFRGLITSDKICSEYINGSGIRRGDSGSGLAFPDQDKGVTRYYLRGIASTAPRQGDGEPADHTPITFTQILKHEYFLKEYL